MPHRGLARRCSWHSFWSSPIASGTRARVCAGPACAISSASSRLAAVQVVVVIVTSRHVDHVSRDLARVQHPRTFSRVGTHDGAPARPIPWERREREKERGSCVSRGKNAVNDLLQMLFPENGNYLQRSMWYRTSCDFLDPDLHGECRMENDNHRHSGQNGREDHLRNQSLHDHPDLYVTYNWRFKEKYVHDAPMGGFEHYANRWPFCERHLHRGNVLRK